MARKKAEKKAPRVVPFPELLQGAVAMINERAAQQLRHAVGDAMKLMNLSPEKWGVDLQNQCFVERGSEPE